MPDNNGNGLKTKTYKNGDSTVGFDNTVLPDVFELKDVGISYDGGKRWVIQGLNLLVEDKPDQGQFVVVLGESGCGKSTVLRFLAGLQKPTAGQVLLNSQPFLGHMPMVFQQYSSLPWLTVLENVMMALKLSGKGTEKEWKAAAMEMTKKVGLDGHEKKYAQYPILSGGQLQRVAIARSLVTNPSILLMDEPFGALDVNTRFRMQMMLADLWLNLNSTVVFVTHDIQEAVYLADDIFIMAANPGRIVEHIPIELPLKREREIKKSPEYIKYVAQVEDIMFSLPSNNQSK